MTFNVQAIRAQFPGLQGLANGKPFTYLDSGATAQKPLAVIERMDRFLRSEYGTVHRGLYARSVDSTRAYEQARVSVARFLTAPDEKNIVFTMGCTDAINLVAWSWGRKHLKRGDRVLITGMEHHANIVPWQITAELTGAELVVCPILDDGSLDMEAFDRLLDSRVKLVSLIHVANSLGTINPVKLLAQKAHAVGAKILLDAAQSAPHMPLDVVDLDCDFLAFAGHKVYGPTGIGVLYGKSDVLESMPPWRGGGEMIEKVTFEKTTFAPPPARFEAGTPPIVEAIGLATACEWLGSLGWADIHAAERDLYAYAEAKLAEIPGLRRIGTAAERSTVLSFTMPNAHASDISSILDLEGVAIRAGHHCAQPVMQRFGVTATARATLGVYSTREDIDRLAAGLRKVAELFG
ncbi:MAG: cysteine desulfurase [Planctomycetes bacterium]|jgi:cysteine desulfurase/selenocysteine lyase|nr:cysteine desulfurase [Planctomycetota bacterium]